MGRLRKPELPPGPLHELMDELHYLHARAGYPSVRDLARGQDFSHTVVHAMFTQPRLPDWPVLCPVVERLADIAPRTDADQWVKKFDRLWDEVLRFESLNPPLPGPADADDSGDPDGSDDSDHSDDSGALQPPSAAEAEPSLPDADDSRVVVIGAGLYTSLPSLPTVARSAETLVRLLTRPDTGAFQAGRTVYLADPEDPRDVLSAIASASRDAGDTLLIYYAGHGILSPQGDLVLATATSEESNEHTGVSYDAVRRILAGSPARRTVVILDCCFSGRAAEAMGPLSGVADAPSTYVLAATSANRVAFAPIHQQYTAFTGELIDIIERGVPGESELLDVEAIYRELKARAVSNRLPIPSLRSRPGSRPLALARNTATPPRAVPPTSGRRVIIAEDEALLRLDLKEMLEEQGYEVVAEAADGETAVRLAEQFRPDLCIFDVRMPILDGIAAAEQVIEARIAPVLILTGFSQRELVARAADVGVMSYLLKPFHKDTIVPAIEIAVSRHAQLNALEEESADLTSQLETRKLVDRAKGILQTDHGMSEAAAFRWIQRRSIDRRLTLREVAEGLIRGTESAAETSAAEE